MPACDPGLNDVLEAGHIGTFDVDLATGALRANAALLELFGRRPGRRPLPAKALLGRLHPEDIASLEKAWAQNRRRGQLRAEFRVAHPDGTGRWVAGHGRFLFDGSGRHRRATRFVGVTYDVTERQHAEQEVKRSREQLAGIVDAAMDAIISVDDSMRVILFNAAAERMFGWSAAEALGRPLNDFLPERHRRRHGAAVRHFGETGATSRMMSELSSVTGLRRGGEEFPIEASISVLNLGGKKIFTAILRDVASRMLNDAVLRRQAQLLHLSHDAIIVWSTASGIEFWNEGAARLYGYGHGESIGRDPQQHLQSEFPNPWPQIEATLRERGSWEGTLRQRNKDGGQVVVAARLQRLSGTLGEGMTILETNRDITDRQRLEEALLRVGEEERQRIGRDLHDGLGQEIAAIALLNNFLQNQLEARGLPEAEVAGRLAGLLGHAGGEVHRISHGLQPVPRDPGSLVAGIRALAADASLASGVNCRLRSRGTVAVHNHESANHLYRIAQEAVQNSLRHARPRNIAVRLAREGGRITLEVEDDGAGFDPARAPARGIGLRTMQYRADAMGGQLELIRLPKGGTLVRCMAPDIPPPC